MNQYAWNQTCIHINLFFMIQLCDNFLHIYSYVNLFHYFFIHEVILTYCIHISLDAHCFDCRIKICILERLYYYYLLYIINLRKSCQITLSHLLTQYLQVDLWKESSERSRPNLLEFKRRANFYKSWSMPVSLCRSKGKRLAEVPHFPYIYMY